MSSDEQLLEVVLKKLEERKIALVEAIANGAAGDFPVYTNLVGQVRGLAAAQMEISDLLRKLKDIDDEN